MIWMQGLTAAIIDDVVPLAAVMMIFGIPIVAILTAHQRKMTELIHGKRNEVNDQALVAMHSEMQQIRAELADLRDRVNQQALERDALAQRMSPPSIETLP